MKARLRSLDSKHQNGQVLVLFLCLTASGNGTNRNNAEQYGTSRIKSEQAI